MLGIEKEVNKCVSKIIFCPTSMKFRYKKMEKRYPCFSARNADTDVMVIIIGKFHYLKSVAMFLILMSAFSVLIHEGHEFLFT